MAASQEYVYIAMADVLYAFDKNGNFVNAVVPPNVIQAVDVFPPAPQVDLPEELEYFYAGFPVIAHNPVANYGYVTIYGPNLDTLTTREDADHPDAPKFMALPWGGIDPPDPLSIFQLINIYDMDIDRFGSILLVVDVDIKPTPQFPDYLRALQILSNLDGLSLQMGGTVTIEDDDGNPQVVSVPAFDNQFGAAAGDLGTICIDTFFPYNRTDLRYTWYTGHYNMIRDFVGVSFIELVSTTVPPSYTVGPLVDNDFGYVRVIGESVGNAPGSFNQNPPLNPDGELEDPDLTNGGPSGMSCDPLSDDVYICDPGNRRVQVFQRDTGTFLRQIGDGLRGNSGSSFIAPSEVALDMEGNIFVADVDLIRVIRENYSDRQFGNVGGTVRNLQLGSPLEGATVSLGNELGTLALRSTNINGDYLFRNLLADTYFLSANKFGFDSDTTMVQIIANETTRADFNLQPNEPAVIGAYTGTIIDAYSNLPVDDVLVQVVGTGLATYTDDIGRFQINNILPGKYQVVFTKNAYVTLTRDVDIFADQTTTDSFLQLMREE